jgi:hypothetical protein
MSVVESKSDLTMHLSDSAGHGINVTLQLDPILNPSKLTGGCQEKYGTFTANFTSATGYVCNMFPYPAHSNWPAEIPNFTPPKPNEHPRLMFRKNELSDLQKRYKTNSIAQGIVARLKEQLVATNFTNWYTMTTFHRLHLVFVKPP